MHKIGSFEKLKADGALGAKVNGGLVAVFLVDGAPVATQGKCPHAGGPLFQGTLCGEMLSCPWHGWTYDLKSGACEEDPSITLQFYSVRVDGDDIYVTL